MSEITVTGPISGGKHGWPYAAAIRDIAAEGYVEEEYFFSGQADRYSPVGKLGTDGRWTVERNGTTPFVTRGLVRRPVDPARFNGTVIVEWNNVSAGSEIFEAGDTHVVFDQGFAYVGVSAQRVGVHGFAADPHGLVAWDPERYGSLEIVDDGIAYGIFSEAGRAVGPERDGAVGQGRRAAVDPLGGLPVQRLLAASALIAAAANAAIPLLDAGPGPTLALRFLTGIALAGVYPPGMKLVASWCKEDRGLGIGLLVGALTLGSGVPHLLNAPPGRAACRHGAACCSRPPSRRPPPRRWASS